MHEEAKVSGEQLAACGAALEAALGRGDIGAAEALRLRALPLLEGVREGWEGGCAFTAVCFPPTVSDDVASAASLRTCIST